MTKWTDEETATLLQMRREGHSFHDIADALGRQYRAVRSKWDTIHETAEQRETRRQRQRRQYQASRPANVKPHVHERLEARPTEEMLAERDRRLALPAPAFGDPLPGYSALDRHVSVDKLL